MRKISLKTLNTENRNITFFFFFINPMGYALLSVEDKIGRTAVRFTTNSSYMCRVELAIKGVLCISRLASKWPMIHSFLLFQARWQCQVTLMSPNKGETGSSPWLPLRLCACVRYWSVSLVLKFVNFRIRLSSSCSKTGHFLGFPTVN